MNMKELPKAERPYEKLELFGEKNLSNAELLAIIIKSGTKEETSVQVAQRILKLNNNYEMFEKIQLESYNWSWSGSEIPIIESRIDYFKELLEGIQKLGSNYIKHCMFVNKKIKSLEIYKKNTIRDEFLREW